MARRKRNDILDRMMAKLSLRGALLHPATLFLGSSAILLFLAIGAWEKYGDRIIDADAMRLTPEKIRLTDQPIWVRTDLKQLVLGNTEDPAYVGPSIMDTSLIAETVASLRSVGWIENINRAEKSKSGLEIDLTYRLNQTRYVAYRPYCDIDGGRPFQSSGRLSVDLNRPAFVHGSIDRLVTMARRSSAKRCRNQRRCEGYLEADGALSVDDLAQPVQRVGSADPVSILDEAGAENRREDHLGKCTG